MTRSWTVCMVAVALFLTSRHDEAGAKDKDMDPPVSIVLGGRQAAANPWKTCCARTGGGNVRVVQAEPDTVVFTMTGAAATARVGLCSSAQFAFELEQCFEIAVADPKIQKVRLSLTSQVIGVLRSKSCSACGHAGVAEICTPAHVAVHSETMPVLNLTLPPRSVCCGENLSVNDREGPISVVIPPGRYTLRQIFGIVAGQGKGLLSSASADFSSGDVFKEEFLGQKEPFRGIAKREFGFQVTLRVEAADHATLRVEAADADK